MNHKYNTIIIGAGAAGLLCAIEAGKKGNKVLILEHNDKIGKKILISGGGRCNFTNIYAKPENFISQNPHFCKSALARYTPQDFISLVEKHKIKYNEKKLGQLFCYNSSKEIVRMLEKECKDAGVEILLNSRVNEISKNEKFIIKTNYSKYECESLVIATGGISIPKIGATDFGYKIAEQFKINIIEPYPGLVPMLFNNNDIKIYGDLAGVSIDAEVNCNGLTFRENILFTHKGLSGPAILQISSYWKKGNSININLLPDKIFSEMVIQNKNSKVLLDNYLAQFLPKRFVEKWCERYFKPKPIIKLNDKEIRYISEVIHNWEIKPSGFEGFGKAEVTIGGIDTNELSSKTMESKKVKGLYFIGECVDVTGWLGGYNFQWAWASGYAAGTTLSQ